MKNRFQKWALATTVATYLLITIGAMVRASDAGLGCPDWPVCFGKPYPPLTQEELLQRDIPEGFHVEDYHVTLAWIEYTNRLAGSVIGFLVLGTLVIAWRDHRGDRHVSWPVTGAFITVLINGWMGSKVVTEGLRATDITIHLMLAWTQVILLLYATVHAFYPHGSGFQASPKRRILARGTLIVLALTMIQAGFGTNLRAQLEAIEDERPETDRGTWIHEVNWVDQVHRSYSWIVLAGTLWLGWYAHKRLADDHPGLRYATQITTALVLAQVAAGIGLAYVSLPPPLQVVHLLVASLLIGSLALVFFLTRKLPMAALRPDQRL